MADYIDFKHVVTNADVMTVLNKLAEVVPARLNPRQTNGAEIRFHCPLHDDQTPSASVNAENRMFRCHACQAEGDILHLVAEALRIDKRAACRRINEWTGCGLSRTQSNTQRGRPPKADDKRPARKREWRPFTKTLDLDADHPWGEHFTGGECVEFGMGYQAAGFMKERWCVRLHDADGNPLGYTGRWLYQDLPENTPRWLFGPGFPKSEFLFNHHRLERNDEGKLLADHLLVVEGPTDAIRLHSLGLPVVALLGTSVSSRQLELLATLGMGQVLLLLDGDEQGRAAVPSVLGQIAQVTFVRDVVLPPGEDPQSVEEEFFRKHLWWH